MISVVILTKDEEVNIDACLDSVSWSDDVLVVDSYSTDRTVERARRRRTRIMQRRFTSFAEQRNAAHEQGQLRHDWVLHLDADERVTPALRDEMLAAIQARDVDAFGVAAKLMFEGVWLRHSSMYPAYQVRLGRRDVLRFSQVGHGQRETVTPQRVRLLEHPLVHLAFSKGCADWLARHNRYSSIEAQAAFDLLREQAFDWRALLSHDDPVARWRALKDASWRLPFRPAWRLLYLLFMRRGVLDGVPGVNYSLLLAIYDFMTWLKLRELRTLPADARLEGGAPLATPRLDPAGG